MRDRETPPVFADLFAGCGGLSLGLMESGWKGIFAIEKDSHAFSTLKANLIDGNGQNFDWPDWLPKEAHDIKEVLRKYKTELKKLRGKIDLLVGGPPCQGFSSAGRRDPHDPRNQLFKRYLKMVGLLLPKMLLLENVQGISSSFRANATREKKEPFSEKIRRGLKRKGYETFPALLRAVDFGVPQLRPRYFLLGVRREAFDVASALSNPFESQQAIRERFLKRLGLSLDSTVSVRDAISDLRVRGAGLINCVDSNGFQQIRYSGPKSEYQKQMHGTMNGHSPNSLRLPNHSDRITIRFEKLVREARKGVSLSDAERKRFGVRKASIVVLDPCKPSHTLTTLPDDYVHYAEPRILTVREYARIQSFPDWFAFQGVYTTGGLRRKMTCPRYTQVGNAVPPRVASYLGELLIEYRQSLLEQHSI